MRSGLVLAAAIIATPLTFASPSRAHAEQYCGFSTQPGAIVECGYTSLQGCQNDIGKGAMCFVNPYLVENTKRATPIARHSEG
jgi:hypothetical protein